MALVASQMNEKKRRNNEEEEEEAYEIDERRMRALCMFVH